MLEEIQNIDNQLIIFVANYLRNPVTDFILPIFRNMYTWVPFYILGSIYIIYSFKVKGIYWILSLIIVIGLTDAIGNYGFKKSFKRTRPCNEISLKAEIKPLIECGSGFSFISNHAANHFAIANFIVLSICRESKRKKIALYLWASIISFAQVYVGVHYFSDIIVGGIVGILVSSIVYHLIPLQYKLKIQ